MQSEIYALQREVDFIKTGEIQFRQFINNLEAKNASTEETVDERDLTETLAKRKVLEDRLNRTHKKKEEIKVIREELSKQINDTKKMNETLNEKANALEFELLGLKDFHGSLKTESARIESNLSQLKQINVINDAFYIWHAGPFATINNFRLGKLPSHQVDWTETNAALGQAAFVISTIASKADVEFQHYDIHPMGSFAKILKCEDNTFYNLYTDGTFSLFPKRNFNIALGGFLHCIKQLGDHVMDQDPTLQLPYSINVDNCTINGLSILTNAGDDSSWTKALKFMLSDIKWIVAWATKHLNSSKYL